jgi:hypothetical protein
MSESTNSKENQVVEESSLVEKPAKKSLASAKKQSLSDVHLKAYSAIINLVNDLWSVFETKTMSCIALYNRLCQRIVLSDKDSINKLIIGFETFYDSCGSFVLENKLNKIPVGTIIKYGDNQKVCLEIQKYIYQSDDDSREIIRNHLLTIMAILKPEKKTIDELERKWKEENSKEGKFVSDLLKRTKETMADVDGDNPMAAMMGLMKSGVVPDLINGLQKGVSSGEMDMGKLFSAMSGAMSSLMPKQESTQEISQSPDPRGSPPPVEEVD